MPRAPCLATLFFSCVPNHFTFNKLEAGESNDTPLLITRNLLKKRDAQNASTALCPIPMYKIMYNEIGRSGGEGDEISARWLSRNGDEFQVICR